MVTPIGSGCGANQRQFEPRNMGEDEGISAFLNGGISFEFLFLGLVWSVE